MPDLPEATALKEACRRYQQVNATYRELELDVAIAEREGGEEKIAAAKRAASDYLTNEWAPAYRERERAARALCEAVGVSVSDMKASL